MANLEKPQGNVPSNTIPKPMEQYNTIILRSRRIVYQGEEELSRDKEKGKEKEKESSEEKIEKNEKEEKCEGEKN